MFAFLVTASGGKSYSMVVQSDCHVAVQWTEANFQFPF